MNEIKSHTKNWNGSELRQIITFKGKRFRIVTGLRNGGGADSANILGANGWAFLFGRDDIDTFDGSNTSYVSSEPKRKAYAEELNRQLKLAIVDIFTDHSKNKSK